MAGGRTQDYRERTMIVGHVAWVRLARVAGYANGPTLPPWPSDAEYELWSRAISSHRRLQIAGGRLAAKLAVAALLRSFRRSKCSRGQTAPRSSEFLGTSNACECLSPIRPAVRLRSHRSGMMSGSMEEKSVLD